MLKHIAGFTLLATLFAMVPAAHAQEFRRNAYGMYAAPTIYGYAKGTDYQLATSGTGLDLGLYYAHSFKPTFSARLEAKFARRGLDDFSSPDSLGPQEYFRLSENILEIPLVLQLDRRIPVSDHELRISVGGGAAYKYVLDQKLVDPSGNAHDLVAADSYQKLAVLLDGGATFGVDRTSAVFLRFRYDIDVSTFSEPAAADVIRRFWAAGFYAGFEYGF